MENEYFDEARKCPNCNVVTYCDACPVCGRRLPRSSTIRWTRFWGGHVAGEDEDVGVLQSGHSGKVREHIDVHEKKETRHTNHEKSYEPKVKFNRKSAEPTHPYFKDKAANRKTNNTANKVAITVAVIFIISIIGVVMFTAFANATKYTKDTKVEIKEEMTEEMIERAAIVGNDGDITVVDNEYDKSERITYLTLENNGDRSFVGEIALYNGKDLLGQYPSILLMPSERLKIEIYTTEKASSYEFTEYEFYEINSTKPDFSFEVDNAYGAVEIIADTELTREDVEILVPYLIESNKYSDYGYIFYIEISGLDDVCFSGVQGYDENEFYFEETDITGHIEDSFTIQIDGNNFPDEGTYF